MATSSEEPHHRLIRRGLKMVAGFTRRHPGVFSVAVLGSVVFAVGSVAMTVVLGRLTDEVVVPAFADDRPRGDTTLVLVALFVVAGVRSAGVVARRFFAGLTGYRVKNDEQRRLGRRYLDLPYRTVQRMPRGRLVAHLDSDIAEMTESLNPLPFAIGVVTLLVTGLVSMWLVDGYLVLVVAALMPTLWLVNRLQTRMTAGPALAVRREVSTMAGVASESFSGAVVVKTLGLAEHETDRFTAAAARVCDRTVELARWRAIFQSVVGLLPDLGAVVLVLVGAWRVGSDALTTGDLVQALALFGVLAFPIHVIGFFLGDLAPAVVARDRLAEVEALPLEPPHAGAELPSGALEVALVDCGIAVDGSPLVRHVDLAVPAGAVVALVGPTGSGKSTVLHALAGLVPADEGEVRVGGRPLADLASASLASRVSIAFQEPYLLGDTVRANVAFGRRCTDAEIVAALELARVREVVDRLPEGVDTVLGERGVTLSGGQRQRLALARALVRRPGLLLLDDATSAVDPVIEEEILAGVRTVGTTVVVVAHRRSTIALADQVVLLVGGEITAIGTHEALFAADPTYRSLLSAYDTDPDPDPDPDGDADPAIDPDPDGVHEPAVAGAAEPEGSS